MSANPIINWMKAFYEVFGTPYPRLSLGVVMVLGALASGAVWKFTANEVKKDHSQPVTVPTTGPASTSGSQSPAITGPDNQIIYGQPPPSDGKSPKSSKEKTKP